MTSEDVWGIARRVLGVYLVVEGLLRAAGAIAMLGIVVPAGSSRAGYVSAALVQGVIGIAAGIILLRSKSVHQGQPITLGTECVAVKRGALQLLGVFFLVHGATTFARAAVGVLTVQAGWTFRASELAAAAVELVSAGVLLRWPGKVATALKKCDGA
jgi:hypothetical protein